MDEEYAAPPPIPPVNEGAVDMPEAAGIMPPGIIDEEDEDEDEEDADG